MNPAHSVAYSSLRRSGGGYPQKVSLSYVEIIFVYLKMDFKPP